MSNLLKISFVVFSCAFARLKILAPESLASQFKDSVIPAEYANFGYIPYGQTVMGKVHLQPNNKYGCNDFNMGDRDEISRSADLTPFWLAMRGECSFVQKVRNMENIGVALGIIVNDKEDNEDGRPLMFDDGTGGGIRIPSMMISKRDGMILIDWLSKNKDAVESIVMMAEFLTNPKDDNRVDMELWYSSTSSRALDFIEDWENFHFSLLEDPQLKNQVRINPRFIFWTCDDCDQEYMSKECFAGGKYCAIDNDPIMPGREIILEDLRQKCLFTRLNEGGELSSWFKYIERVHATCYSKINEDCSRNAHSRLGLDYLKTWQCVEDSFSAPQKDWDQRYVANKIIDEEMKHWEQFGTLTWPSLLINDRHYRGQIEPVSVFNAICASFQKPPIVCNQILNVPKPVQMVTPIDIYAEDFTPIEIAFMIFAVLGTNVVLLYCCRRRWRREMKADMQTQIESQIGQYYALQTQGQTKTQF